MTRTNAIALASVLTFGIGFFASCSLFESLRTAMGPARAHTGFPHAIHVVENEMACGDCHVGGAEKAEAGTPTLEGCADCHDEPDEGSKVDTVLKDAKARKDAGRALWSEGAGAGDLVFHHGRHLAGISYALPSGQKKPLQCSDCHGDAGRSDRLPERSTPPMELCTDCHGRGGAAAGAEGKTAAELLACAVCHETIRADVPPEDHRGLWGQIHGEELAFGLDEEEARRCAYCHRRDFCTECHDREKPRSHNQYFRIRGHGIEASLERDRCSVCHLEDFCIRCHQGTRPQSHTGSWLRAPFRHCDSCHLPLESQRCTVCHKSAPHTEAVNFPRDANHTGSCLMSCHTNQHPDPGITCSSCHR